MQLLPHELIVDNFAGGGGTSTGLEAAFGRPVDIAINHDPEALAMHRINHPTTKHYCESVWDVDPIKVTGNQPVGLVWLSPDCKHFSKAKGGVPVSKRVRGLAWVALRWASKCRPRVIMLENVEEFKTWGPLNKDGKPCKNNKGKTFNSFIRALEQQGYTVDFRELRACDYGAPTTRKRFFLIARRDGLPIVWPKPTHGNPNSLAVKKAKLKPWRIAAECIDWSIPCPSIFERSKPLADNTCKRIAAGIMRYVVNNPNPFIVNDKAPVLTEIANTSSPRCMLANEPLRTICAQIKGGHHALIAPFIAKNYTGVVGSQLIEPLHTVTACDHNSLVAPTLVVNTTGHPGANVSTPLKTVTTGRHHALVAAFLSVYYGNERDGQELTNPLRTLTAESRFALTTVNGINYQIDDIGFRMLQPRELFRAQGFDDSYIIDKGIDEHGNIINLTKTAQTRMVGNSVCPPIAKALVEANFRHEKLYSEVA